MLSLLHQMNRATYFFLYWVVERGQHFAFQSQICKQARKIAAFSSSQCLCPSTNIYMLWADWFLKLKVLHQKSITGEKVKIKRGKKPCNPAWLIVCIIWRQHWAEQRHTTEDISSETSEKDNSGNLARVSLTVVGLHKSFTTWIIPEFNDTKIYLDNIHTHHKFCFKAK